MQAVGYDPLGMGLFITDVSGFVRRCCYLSAPNLKYSCVHQNRFGLVRVVDATGVIRTVAGNGQVSYGQPVLENVPATSVGLSYALNGVVSDGASGIVITDSANCCLRRVFGRNRTIVTVAGQCGNCVYANYSNPITPFVDGCVATMATLGFLYGVAADTVRGGYYASDQTSGCIIRILPSGTLVTAAGNCTRGVLSSAAGIYDGIFNVPATGEGGPGTSALLGYVFGLSTDGAGGAYFTDQFNVYRLFYNGTLVRAAGDGQNSYTGDGGPATMARLWNPRGVAWDSGACTHG